MSDPIPDQPQRLKSSRWRLLLLPLALFRRWIPLVLVLLPPLLVAGFLRRYLLNVPFMDDYVWLPLYEKVAHARWTLEDFFFVQMEHRLTVPAIIVWVLHQFNGRNITLQNWVSFGQICLSVANIGFLIWRTVPDRIWRWTLLVMASWTAFSTVQCYTFLWSDCFSSFLPTTFLTTALVLFHARLRPWLKFVLCFVCAELATQSFASGILLWLLLVPLILWSEALPDGPVRRRFLGAWVLAFAVTMAFYFHHLVNQAAPEFSYKQGHEETMSRHLAAFFGSPLESLQFTLISAGSLVGRGTFAPLKNSSLLMGSLLSVVLAVAVGFVWLRRRERTVRTRMLPWLVLGVYTLGTGAMVALGRIWASPSLDGALWNRYTTHAVPLTVAAAVLGVLLMREWLGSRPQWHTALVAGSSTLAGAFIAMLAVGWIYGARQMDAWWSSRLRDATCNLFARVLPPDRINGPLTGNLPFALRMDDLGMMRPPLLKDASLKQFNLKSGIISERTAKLDTVEAVGHGKMQAQGFAYLPGHERVADGVLLCYKSPTLGWTVFAVGQVSEAPLYLNDVLNADMQYIHLPYGSFRRTYGYFNVRFDVTELPEGRYEIGAWAFDFKRQNVWKMAGRYRINTKERDVVPFGGDTSSSARKSVQPTLLAKDEPDAE